MDLKNKKVLLVGLGLLGGGLSTAKYLIKKGAILTITDLRSKEELRKTIQKLPENIRFVLGRNPESELKKADIIILNPAVSAFSPLVKRIKELKKEYYTDYTYFLKQLEDNKFTGDLIGITGTRGKTTIATWINCFITDSVLGGNVPKAGLFKIIDQKTSVYVLELSSFQLEHITRNDRSPNIAIITNVYTDHLNRYKTFEKYFKMKKLIYSGQTEEDILILNNDEPTTRKIEKDKPKGRIYYVSLKELPANKDGLYIKEGRVYQKNSKSRKEVGTVNDLAPHEKYNFMFASLAANLYGVSWTNIFKKTKNLKNPLFRQQIAYNKKRLKIINDSAGTSPEATIAAVNKFNDPNLCLITGGTDKELDFKKLAKTISITVKPEHLYLLTGSGTNKLIEKLPAPYLKTNQVRAFENLEEIIMTVSKEIHEGIIVFSPGAASFEKFNNEFDRGYQFNKLVKKYFK